MPKRCRRHRVRGRGFPIGLRVAIFSEQIGPPGDKPTQQTGEVIAGANGTITVRLLAISGDHIDLDGRTPEGTRYAITAAVPQATQTTAFFTVVRKVRESCFPRPASAWAVRFPAYWELNCGFPQTGYPLTEEFEQRLEGGRVYLVQYFERARFEYHPENPVPYDVPLGRFGSEILGPTGGPNLP